MRRKADTFAALAAGADSGRRIVCSVGSLDGGMLAALANVRIVAIPDDGSEPSTWGEGVNHGLQAEGGDDGSNENQ